MAPRPGECVTRNPLVSGPKPGVTGVLYVGVYYVQGVANSKRVKWLTPATGGTLTVTE